MYEAIIAKIDKVEEIPGANSIQIGWGVLGEVVVVSKSNAVGDVGIFFPCDLQLSPDYCKYNNLYRDKEKNVNPEAKGFFDDNRKVRAQKFMKVKSDGYFAPLESLQYTGICLDPLREVLPLGRKFNELKLHPNSSPVQICCKYVSPVNLMKSVQGTGKKGKVKPQAPLFREHTDTDQFKYNLHKIPVGALLSFHAKVHGTSARYGHTIVRRPPVTLMQRLLDKVGLYNGENWEFVAGTRRVLLQNEHRDKLGYNGPEAFRFKILDHLKPHLSKGMTVYGEIAGYANNSPIMGKHSTAPLNDKAYVQKYGPEMIYEYGCGPGMDRFHIYRITVTTEDGFSIDFTDAQVHAWAQQRGFFSPFEVHPPIIYDGDKDKLLALVTQLTERPGTLTEDYIDPSHISEGIVVRVDHVNTTPLFLKNKSWAFKVMEGIFKESNVDLEDAA